MVTTDNPSNVHTPDVETPTLQQEISSDPHLPSDATKDNDAEIGTKYDADGNIQYWYNMRFNIPTTIRTGDSSPAEFSRVILETQHWKSTKLLCAVEVRDPRVPTSYDKAIILLSRKRYYLDCVCKSRGRLSQDSSLAVDLLSC